MFNKSRELTPRAQLEYQLGEPPTRVELSTVRAVDPRVIIFERSTGPEANASIFVAREGYSAPLEQTYVLHSPTGLEFGYGGSGPADTALNVLSLVLTPRESWRLHQHFKELIARVPREGGRLELAEVRAWIVERYEAELADTVRMTDEREMRELLTEIEQETAEADADGEPDVENIPTGT